MPNFRDLIDKVANPPQGGAAPRADAKYATDEAIYDNNLGFIAMGLQKLGHIYGGTVPEGVVKERRAKNRNARRQRRGNAPALRRAARLAASKRRSSRTQGRKYGRYIYLDGISEPIDAEVVDE